MEQKKMILDVNEKPPIAKWIVLAFQHIFAMFGATVLVPLLVNADAGAEVLSTGVALISSGIGTLIYILCTRGKSPVYLGSSFAFISPLIAAYVLGGISGAMTGIMIVGLIYIIVATIIHFTGKKWINKLLPPVVIGPMIMIIGLSLAASAVTNIGLASDTIDWKIVGVAGFTFLVTAICAVRGKGFLKVIPFLVGITSGYILSICLGMVDFTAIKEASFFGLPNFSIPFVHYNPNFLVGITMAPIALVTMAEHIGDHKALSSIIDKDLIEDPGLDKTLLGDGLATFVAGALGGPANTTYGENTAVVGMSKVASVWVTGLAAIIAIVLGFLGKFTAIISSIPWAVLGGVTVLLYGFIAVNGLKVLIENRTDFNKTKNVIVASAMLVLGLGGAAISFVRGDFSLSISGMSLAAIIGILLNLLIPNEKEDKITKECNCSDDCEIGKDEKVINVDKIREEIEEIMNDVVEEDVQNANDEIKEEISSSEQENINTNVIELNHPLVEHKLAILRDKNTGTKEFREIVSELATMLCYEAMKNADTYEEEIETPIQKTIAHKIDENNYVFLPILRAGTGMLDGIINIMPNAKIGHIGMYRDEETFKPNTYFFKVPKNISEKEVIVLDPMVATGGSILDTVEHLKKVGVTKIKVLAIICAPEGIKAIKEKYPEVEIYCTKIDEGLNDKAYIVPGLGDAGDRIFGTK
ncbi:MAG: uracil phosphoribosyltransferase [Clostridia bacterium]|nr:uracil phosphoribosyltransferase [Clostridia bacterium]MBR4260820.1 uracil phosphoribosyltransferase [Clostridia bacterium]